MVYTKESYLTSQQKCNNCSQTKPAKKFGGANRKDKVYTSNICSSCRSSMVPKDKAVEILANRTKKVKLTLVGRASMLYTRYKMRAKKVGLEFTITREMILAKLNIGICEKTGIKLVLQEDKVPNAPSIDRIDCLKGYTPENIQLTCLIYNYCKNSFSDDDVLAFIKSFKIFKSK